jgi:D-hexose-6-phosphate mutarotase
MHGLVRTRTWKVESVEAAAGDAVRAVFIFDSTPETRAVWDHAFALRYVVTVAKDLKLELEVTNRSAPPAPPFKFEEALHTYLSVGDVRGVAIDGLWGTTYLDKVHGGERRKQEDKPLKLTGPTDRVYIGTKATCVIDDPTNGRKLSIAKGNSDATVVWNPWQDRIGGIPDLDAEEWPQFLCVETCNAKDNAMELAPGARHTMTATIGVA